MIRTERELKTEIQKRLIRMGALPVNQINRGRGHVKGVSDLLVCYRGLFIAIETKEPGWKPPGQGTSKYDHYFRQERFLEQVRQSGGKGFFAQSLEDVAMNLGLNVF